MRTPASCVLSDLDRFLLEHFEGVLPMQDGPTTLSDLNPLDGPSATASSFLTSTSSLPLPLLTDRQPQRFLLDLHSRSFPHLSEIHYLYLPIGTLTHHRPTTLSRKHGSLSLSPGTNGLSPLHFIRRASDSPPIREKEKAKLRVGRRSVLGREASFM